MEIKIRKEDKIDKTPIAQKRLSHLASYISLPLFFLFLISIYLHYRTHGAYRPGIGYVRKCHAKFTGIIKKLSGSSMKIKTINLKNLTDEHSDSLGKTNLPVFELYIPRESQDILCKAIPKLTYDPANPAKGNTFVFSGCNGFKWPFVSAKLKYKDKTYDVKVRYRGWNYDHYRFHKKSWRIRFKKNDLFYGLREINIVNQRSGTVFQDVLQNYLLREAGFLIPNQYLIHLRLNDKYEGVQTFLEQLDEYFLTKHNRSVGDIYGEKRVLYSFKDFSDLSRWQKYASWKNDSDYSSLERLIAVLKDKRALNFKERIEKILDVNQYLTYCADCAITAKVNPSSHNIRLYYDPIIGKFQIIPWYQMGYFYDKGFTTYFKDLSLEEFDLGRIRPVDLIINDIFDGLFKIPEYHEIFYRKIWELINSVYHSKHLLQLVDYMYEQIKTDVYADAHMHSIAQPTRYFTNAEWEKAVTDMKAMIIARDRYIRTYMNKCNLIVSLVPYNRNCKDQNEKDMAVIGKFQLYTSDMISPVVESITLCGEELSRESSEDVFLSWNTGMAPDQKKVCVQAKNINPSTKQITFELNKTIISDKEIVPFHGSTYTTRGLLIDGFRFAQGAELKSLPTMYDYILTVKHTYSDRFFRGLRIQSVKARNSITGKTIEPTIVKTGCSFAAPKRFNPENNRQYSETQGLTFIKERQKLPSKKITWKGELQINEDTILDNDTVLNIEPGTVIEFANGKSLLIYGQIIAKGTEQDKIVFRPKTNYPWGVIAISAPGFPPSIFKHCIIENGNTAMLNDVHYTGALSIYNGNALIENCLLQDNIGDDALNCRYSDTKVTSCYFVNNQDAIDYDFCNGAIIQNIFENNKNDSIDLSFSNTKIIGNNIIKSEDKGISVGEKSAPIIFNNLIVKGDIGIAVKDLSNALILNNTISKNRLGVVLFMKKFTFGRSTANILNSIVWDNQKDIETRNGSVVTVRYSNVGQLLNGTGNINADPLFVAPDKGNFNLRKNSPCILKGNGVDLSKFFLGQNFLLDDIGCMKRQSTEL